MKYYKINKDKLSTGLIKKAAKFIKQGKLVAFPTETVYGLGADALNSDAVLKIYEAKKRPRTNPLIVHVASMSDVFQITEEVPDSAIKLMEKFWPGPLTLVMKKSGIVPKVVTGGLNTVAVRMPQNSIALELVRQSGRPIAAPSANIFTRTSPTSAQHVIDDLEDKIDVVIDGGSTDVGVESTIIDMTDKPYKILRPGGIPLEELKEVLKEVENNDGHVKKIRSPGMMPKHYSPKADLILFEKKKNRLKNMKEEAEKYRQKGDSIGILVTEENKDKFKSFKTKVLGPGSDYKSCAANLYRLLREFDKEKVDIILAEGLKREGLGAAIMDRLQKAGG
ncbi:MAG: L-threonylcarbamoyladenylate synthase [Elusimicrobia bacterium]|jgi:L-threonylcarbamoyladenylate synthase|nr:L-threonylcarbamoyladenylate synthase [Elusimicrobiota bacterium]